MPESTIEKLTEIKMISPWIGYDIQDLLIETSLKSSEEKEPTVIPDESSEDEDKWVRFDDHLINESSLNPSLIEWIWHN